MYTSLLSGKPYLEEKVLSFSQGILITKLALVVRGWLQEEVTTFLLDRQMDITLTTKQEMLATQALLCIEWIWTETTSAYKQKTFSQQPSFKNTLMNSWGKSLQEKQLSKSQGRFKYKMPIK